MSEPEALANESWINSRWRPMMAWQYFTVCACDFIVFPAMNSAYNIADNVYHDWHPLTLQGGGLYHLAMGAIVGVATWQRSQEKMAIYGAAGGGMSQYTEKTEISRTGTTPKVPASDEPDGSRIRDAG